MKINTLKLLSLRDEYKVHNFGPHPPVCPPDQIRPRSRTYSEEVRDKEDFPVPFLIPIWTAQPIVLQCTKMTNTLKIQNCVSQIRLTLISALTCSRKEIWKGNIPAWSEPISAALVKTLTEEHLSSEAEVIDAFLLILKLLARPH